MAGFDKSITRRATEAQTQAADPEVSVFVEANAGSGKTRVLVDRVVNILLKGVSPDRILCVTYTKAAAAEMKSRLFERLGEWSVAPDDELRDSLKKHGVSGEDREALSRARRLFALALETPGGLKIQTIHAFCESLLRRFPLESGALPGFETLDDAQTRETAALARKDVLQTIKPETVDQILEAGGPDAFDSIFRWAESHRYALLAALERAGSGTSMRDALYQHLGVDAELRLADEQSRVWLGTPKSDLVSAADALDDLGGKNDQTRAQRIRQALAMPDPANALASYYAVFFTDNGHGHQVSKLATAAIAKGAPQVLALLEREAERLEAERARLKALRVAEASQAAMTLALPYLDALAEHRAARRALDFDDLIMLAGNLLRPDNAFSGWVGYKLDGQLAHALIDEAQDTSPAQWAMIKGLTAEFFAGAGAQTEPRSLFVVGDEKQSIYSFQGADPAGFIQEGDRLAALTREAGLPFRRPGMDVSFRSSADILSAVDQAFSDYLGEAPEKKFLRSDDADESVRGFSSYQTHRAARRDTPGCVEFWPAIPRPETVVPKSIFDPLDVAAKGSARDVLARSLALEIRAMLDRGDAVWQEEDGRFVQRAVEPRDIGILVWRRTGGFFEEMIRQLKLANVPVAGADRMVMRDQTIVKDLLALGRFAVTSSDDLALAEVLKSPFFDPDDGNPPRIDDAALTDLVQTRPTQDRGGLWRALLRTEDTRFIEARDALKAFRDGADTQGLYSLFTGFLNARSASGETRWARCFARLGEEARDPAEEFLNRALQFEQRENGSLAKFIALVAAEEHQLKRELSTQHNEVQIMTVHASKGLERPVIILPDTTRSPLSGRSAPLFLDETAGLIWSPRKEDDPLPVARARERAREAQRAEHERLLYVALTRARDRLIVCGWKQGQGSGKIAPDSWYARLQTQWAGWETYDAPVSGLEGVEEPGLRLGSVPPALGQAARGAVAAVDLPAWVRTPAPREAAGARPVNPSSLLAAGESDPAVSSPLGDQGAYRYRRGEVIHKLLETLPGLSPNLREAAAMRFLAAQPDLDAEQRDTIRSEALNILEDDAFSALFGPGSRAEVSLSGWAPGLPQGVFVRGQVDRLIVTDHEVMIIDYKTNRPPPDRVEDVPPVYLGQMAAYHALLRALHPDKRIRSALLWTDAARLMELPEALLEQVLQRGAA